MTDDEIKRPKAKLWCVFFPEDSVELDGRNIRAVAMEDFETAVAIAGEWNAENASAGPFGLSMCFPRLWPGTPEEHATELEKLRAAVKAVEGGAP